MSISVAALTVLLLVGTVCSAQSVELRYGLFTAGPEGSFDSSGAVPAIELAEELINNHSSILPGYILSHTRVADTLCNRTVAFNEYFSAISPPSPTIVGVLGCGCSVATTPVAEVVHYSSLSLVSYASSSVELTERSRFPNFFRTHISDADFAPSIAAFIQYYGWSQIAYITQDEGIFTENLERIRTELMGTVEVENVLVQAAVSSQQISEHLAYFDGEEQKIFFVNTYSDIASKIICQAYIRGMMYPRYVWLTYGWYQEGWWRLEENLDCSQEQLTQFLHRTFALQLFPRLNDSNAMTDTGLTPNQFDDQYRERLGNYTYSFLATLSFDALWAFALALNKTSNMVAGMSRDEVLNVTQCEDSGWPLIPLENFTYTNQLMGCVIRWNLQATDFIGLSGRTQFNSIGTRIHSLVELFQYRLTLNDTDVNRVLFGYSQLFNTTAATITFESDETNITIFPEYEGGVPSDGKPLQQVNTFHTSLVVIYYILAFLGIIFTTVCLIFNTTQRNKKVVKLTSPNLNYFIIIGAYILYLSIFFRVLPTMDIGANYARCIIESVCVIVGYCLAYGAILAKMGRIYYIFTNPSPNKKKVKDWILVLIVLGVTGVGSVLALLQVAIPQLRPVPELHSSEEYGTESRNEFGVQIDHVVYQCFSFSNIAQSVWLWIVFAYLALLQIIGIILALQTRKVKIKILNDSKYIAALIYSSSIALILFVMASTALESWLSIGEMIASGGLLGATTMFLALVFVPKMVSLYKDPEGKSIFDTDRATDSSFALKGMHMNSTKPQQNNNGSSSNGLTESESKVTSLSLEPDKSVGSSL